MNIFLDDTLYIILKLKNKLRVTPLLPILNYIELEQCLSISLSFFFSKYKPNQNSPIKDDEDDDAIFK